MQTCRTSGVSTSTQPPEYFDDSEDYFTVDRQGDRGNLDFDCPDTLAEMLVIIHEYQAKRNDIISAFQGTCPPPRTPPQTQRSRSKQYDFYCEPDTQPIHCTPRTDDKYGESPAVSASAISQQELDEQFADSD